MLDNQSIERLIKNVVKAIQANDSSLLTVKSVRWILANWDLKPRMDDILPRAMIWPDAKIAKRELTAFFKSFNCFEHFICDVDLNHVLGIINYYVKKEGITENNRWWILNFRQRCFVTNEVRKRIGLKAFNIHSLYKRHQRFYPEHKWSYQKSVTEFYGRDMKEAVIRFRAHYRDDSHPHFKSYFWFIRRVRELKSSASFMLNANHIEKSLFEILR